jgi:hypothetical protein
MGDVGWSWVTGDDGVRRGWLGARAWETERGEREKRKGEGNSINDLFSVAKVRAAKNYLFSAARGQPPRITSIFNGKRTAAKNNRSRQKYIIFGD